MDAKVGKVGSCSPEVLRLRLSEKAAATIPSSEADEPSGWTEMVVLFLGGLGCSAGHATAQQQQQQQQAQPYACMHARMQSFSR